MAVVDELHSASVRGGSSTARPALSGDAPSSFVCVGTDAEAGSAPHENGGAGLRGEEDVQLGAPFGASAWLQLGSGWLRNPSDPSASCGTAPHEYLPGLSPTRPTRWLDDETRGADGIAGAGADGLMSSGAVGGGAGGAGAAACRADSLGETEASIGSSPFAGLASATGVLGMAPQSNIRRGPA